MDGSGRLGRGRRLRLVLGVAVFCAAGPGSVLAQATFSAIEVKGNQRIETATVLSYAGLPTNAPVSVGEVNAAKQRIVNSGLFETVDTPHGPVRFPGVPTWFSRTPGRVQGFAPELGADTAEVLAELDAGHKTA